MEAGASDREVALIAAVRASRGTVRLFLVGAATKSHARYLTGRLAGLERSPWGAEVAVYWADGHTMSESNGGSQPTRHLPRHPDLADIPYS
jgi:hypothetical protein